MLRRSQFLRRSASHQSSPIPVSRNRSLKISVPWLLRSLELLEVDHLRPVEDARSVVSHRPLPTTRMSTDQEELKTGTINDLGSKLHPHLLRKLVKAVTVDRFLRLEVLLNLLLPSIERFPSCSIREETVSLFYRTLSFSFWVSYLPLLLSLVSHTRIVLLSHSL